MAMDIGVAKTSCVGISGSKRQKSPRDELEDRIRNLPDSILVHILSFLPTRDAVHTVLIPSFRGLWTSTHSLDFDGCLYHDCSEENYEGDDRRIIFIRHALILHASATIYQFRLKYFFRYSDTWDTYGLQEIQDNESYIKERRLANEIDTWISFAVSREVQILDVDLKACSYVEHGYCYKLPNFVLRSCHLTELKLVGCALNPKGHIHMRSLKTLSLREIMLSDNLIHRILSGCPLLEDLSLLWCHGLCKLDTTSPCLKKLVIEVGFQEESKLEISCPTVRSLYISGWLERVELKNVPSVVDATFEFSYMFRGAQIEYHELRRLFEKLHHAKALRICTWTILVFTIWELKSMPCRFFDWKYLVLEMMQSKLHLLGIANLLRHSPHLETLNIRVTSRTSAIPHADGMWLKPYEFDDENYWNSLQPFHCLMNHLKTVHLNGCITSSYAIQMVKFLLRSSMVLEKVVIYTKPDEEPQWLERLLECTQKLSSFPRASSSAVILFV